MIKNRNNSGIQLDRIVGRVIIQNDKCTIYPDLYLLSKLITDTLDSKGKPPPGLTG